MTTLQIELPDTTAQAAQAAGLLTPQSIDRLLTEALRKREAAIERFKTDPVCRCIILQPTSAGFGIDGLQLVCHNMLVIEAPITAPPFHQVVARLDREGQTVCVNCRVAIAIKTVQVNMFHTLLSNDSQINRVQRGYRDLKEIVFGDSTK